jgi:hypothetical protein
MKVKFAAFAALVALVPASGAWAFPEQPGDQYQKRQTGCASAFEHAISGSGGQHANPGALENGLEVFTGLCLP